MRFLPLAGLAFLLAACSPDAPAVEEETSAQTEVTFDSQIAGAEVTSILTEGGEVRLGLTDEVLYFGLTDLVAKEVEAGLEDAESEGGLGGFIAGAVSNAVTGALTTPVQIPLDNVQDIRYENGRLQVDFDGEHSSVDLEIDDEPVDQQFDPEEARQFAEAFHELTGR
ncbi:MAG: hypothetical protein Rubg2KO_06530 [Rubricoccaceae bacterium]